MMQKQWNGFLKIMDELISEENDFQEVYAQKQIKWKEFLLQ